MNNSDNGDDSLGRAANRYVTFQIVSAIIGGIIFLIFLFAFFLPMFNRTNSPPAFATQGPQQIPAGAGVSGKTTLTINGRPATPEEQRSFDEHFNKPQVPNSPPPSSGGSPR
jgi:hypothetical protein